jgi:hypothetical protein
MLVALCIQVNRSIGAEILTILQKVWNNYFLVFRLDPTQRVQRDRYLRTRSI